MTSLQFRRYSQYDYPRYSVGTGTSRESSISSLPYFDLNNLPYLSQMRSCYLVVCLLSYLVAHGVFMPLGMIQAAYDQRCFLYTKISLHTVTYLVNGTEELYSSLTLNAASTAWGPLIICNYTTFQAVSVAIYSMVFGWSTFTVWPAFMSLGRAGAVTAVYMLMGLVSVAGCGISLLLLEKGFNFTCQELVNNEQAGITNCEQLNNEDIKFTEVANVHWVRNIYKAMKFSMITAMLLTGLEVSKVLINIGTFVLMWVHLNIIPNDLLLSDDDDTSSYSDEEPASS